MDEQLVSINEIRERYAAEDLELSAPFVLTEKETENTIVARLSIYKGQNDDGNFTGGNGLQLNIEVDGESVAHTFLENDVDGEWTLDNVATTFKIPLDAKVWEVGDPG
ncbi:MAG TPA: hypothetical protein VE732_04115 [Nitrososphaera sp.]|jgi:hypothetical protein|nr:hypothetical protein [Nitrososphaera sp.]